MKLLLSKSTTVWGIGVAIALLFVGLLFGIIYTKTTSASQDEGRLITIYDRGDEEVFLSDAATIADALKDAEVSLDSHDVVEPGLDEKLVATEYKINIYRARPVTIVDGALRQKVMTAYQTPEQIIKDADISLYPEDITKLSRSDDFVANGAGLELDVTRATPFNFTLYGSTTEARTQAKTVGDMLKEKKITLGDNGRVSLPLEAPLTSGLDVQVWREGRQTITVDEAIPYGVEKIRDADREPSYKAVQTEGKDGSRKVTYDVEIRDGKEVNRSEIASLTTTEPVTQVEVIGTKLPTPTNPTENQAVGHEMMLAAGYGEDQWPCLYNLWMRESGWKTTAGNVSSGAYGIPQALPASKMAAFGSDYLSNARTQIAWGLSYIKGRYSTPCGAWDSFLQKNWY